MTPSTLAHTARSATMTNSDVRLALIAILMPVYCEGGFHAVMRACNGAQKAIAVANRADVEAEGFVV